MPKTEVLQTRIAPELRKDTEAVLDRLGLTTGQAINIFFNQIVLTQSVPLKLEVPQYSKSDIDKMLNEAITNIKNGSVPIEGDTFFDMLEAKYAE